MPKLQDFNVEFDRHNATYKPGQTVRGTVVFTLTEPKNVRGIRFKARGKANVDWTEGTGRNKRYYRNKESYFKIIDQLAVCEAGDEQLTLEVGQHSYHFSFQLPHDIPSSFQCSQNEYVWVHYTVKAILDRPWRFDHKVASVFTVLGRYDPRIKEDFAEGIDHDFEHSFLSYCCFDAGFMKFNVNSRTSGYYPGDIIKLKINYDRSSTQVNIREMKLKLMKIVTLHSSGSKTSLSETLERVYDTGPFRKRGQCVMKIEVPELSPANLQHCSIIDVDYQLALYIKVSGMHSKISRFFDVQLWDTEERR